MSYSKFGFPLFNYMHILHMYMTAFLCLGTPNNTSALFLEGGILNSKLTKSTTTQKNVYHIVYVLTRLQNDHLFLIWKLKQESEELLHSALAGNMNIRQLIFFPLEHVHVPECLWKCYEYWIWSCKLICRYGICKYWSLTIFGAREKVWFMLSKNKKTIR